MKTSKAIKLAGDGGTLGRLFDPPITRQAVHRWGENVPPLREFQLRAVRPEWFPPERVSPARKQHLDKKRARR